MVVQSANSLFLPSLLAVILAGGQSSRMGQDKAQRYSPRLGATLLSHTLQLLAQLDSVKVVLSGGRYSDGIADTYPHRGPLSGVHGALEAFCQQEHIKELLFVPVDMPNLSLNTLNDLVEFGRKKQCAVYINQSYLPFYVPNTSALLPCVTSQLCETNNWSIRALLHRLNGLSMSSQLHHELINVNESHAWDIHCA